jgi:amino acid transporter
VGISAGVGALISAMPSLQKHTLALCLIILVAVTLINLRGVSETGGVFLAPTYLFIFCLLAMIVLGVVKTLAAGGHPVPLVSPHPVAGATEALGIWLLARAFASGCTAMTGVEAVSNGVLAFKEPASVTARFTLTLVIGILTVMLGGIAFLCKAYGIAATPPGQAGYQSVLSQLLGAITGKGIFYGVSIGAILLVLALSANTAFADFPRLGRAIAQNGFLPHGLAVRGRRLIYTQGVYALALLAGTLLIVFDGVTDRLIPLYAVGAFMAFTLSQAGMVMHWKRVRGPGATKSMLVNGLGAIATGLTVAIVLVAKFTEGAWITLLLIPGLILTMRLVKRHYNHVSKEIGASSGLDTRDLLPPLVVITIDRWSRITNKALRFAMTISPDVRALHVESDQESDHLVNQWAELVEEPARRAGLAAPRLFVVRSPYRFVLRPILDYVVDLEKANPGRQIAVLTPELVELRWYFNLLHNHRAAALKAMLLFQGSKRITVINIPWYLTE